MTPRLAAPEKPSFSWLFVAIRPGVEQPNPNGN
jgi:hypothetical protein